jgi:imidazole glycerol-phosphate synthase subunit HisH
MEITIIDYGVGNLSSVQNMLKRNGTESIITRNATEILRSKKIILPGVGAFDAAMSKILDLQLDSVIRESAKREIPILGICLGAQLLLEGSEEGNLAGLGLIKGRCKKFVADEIAPLKVPHMGWNEIQISKPHPLLRFDDTPRFYFVHSYYMHSQALDEAIAQSVYGHKFTSVISRGCVSGVQFHPEKSHRFGARLLLNFANQL